MSITHRVMFYSMPKSIFNVCIVIAYCITTLLPINELFSQSSTCVPGMVQNASTDVWSEECYLNSMCQEQGMPCQANDVRLLGVYLADVNGDPLPTCQIGMSTTVYLWGTFFNNAMQSRRAVRTRTEIWLNGVFTNELNACSFDVLPPGTTNAALIGSFSYPCGQTLELLNTWIGWETANNKTCANTTLCGDYSASKCYKNYNFLSFLSPNFAYSCGLSTMTTTEVCFIDLTMGGNPPYTYKWYFGDGDSSTLANPCHTYNATSGSFLVELYVTDDSSIVAGSFLTINLDSLVCCTLDITCPNSMGGLFTCKSLIPAPATDTTAFKNLGGMINDFCGMLTLSHSDSTNMAQGCIGDTFKLYRTYKLKDGMNDSVLCTILYRVVDNIMPTIVCPAPLTLNCEDVNTPPTTGTATATDNCTSIVTNISHADVITVIPDMAACPGRYLILRTWTATDSCSNSASCVQQLTIVDTTRPLFTTLPSNLIVNCDGMGNLNDLNNWLNTNGGAIATEECSDTIWSNNFSGLSNLCGITGSATVIFTVMDSCGNSNNASATFTIQDTTKPIITCQTQTTPLNCPATPVWVSATATDVCDATVAITFTDNTINGSCTGTYTTTRTWTATDDCVNTAICSATIVVQDITAPLITCVAQTTPINCPAPPVWNTSTATDVCDMTVAITFSDASTAGTCAGTSSNTRTWTATDDCGNTATCSATIVVQDITAPLITCVAQTTPINCPATPVWVAATATDACDMTVTITNSDETTTMCGNTYTTARTWTATDDCGNSSTCSRSIAVVDTTKPIITCQVQVTPINCPAAPVWVVATATDVCDMTVVITNSDVTTTMCGNTYTTARTWTATDDCGNSSTCSRSIAVVDTTKPIITCPTSQILNLDANCMVAIPDYRILATTSDACNTPILTQNPAMGTVFTGDQLISVTITSTDACGNSVSCSFDVDIRDITPPTITCPNNMTVNNDPGLCSAVVTYNAPVYSDNCPGATLNQYAGLPSGSTFTLGTTVNRFRVTDGQGNSATCAFNITIKDAQAPTLTCPANITTYARQTLCSQIVDYSVLYSDNCPGIISLNYSHPPKYAFVKGVTTVTVSAQDQANNIAYCTFKVTVIDTVKPTPTCVTRTDSVTTGTACAKNVTFNMTAIDNCSGAVKTYTPPSGSVFTVGTTPVLFVVTDAVGNSASCTFNVVLLDRVKPNVVCKNKTISLNTQTSCTLMTSDVIQSSSDNCGVATKVLNPNPITCAHTSPTILTVTVTDIYGNTKTCTSTITISGRNACGGGGSIVGSEENEVDPQADENNIPETASERLVSNAIHVIPNPVIDNMEILFDLPVTDGTITIYDAFGKIIQRMELESGATSLSLNVSDDFVWKGGMYYAQLSSIGQVYTKGFMIIK